MAQSARTGLVAIVAPLAACADDPAPVEEPVDMVPGRYVVAVAPDKFAEYFEAIVDSEQTVCIHAEPKYVPAKLARVFMEPDEACWSAEFERAGNWLTGSTYCPSPRRDMRAGMVLDFDGAIRAEEITAKLAFEVKADPATLSNEDRRDVRRLGRVEGRFQAWRTGNC
jgi:hypothetical protein